MAHGVAVAVEKSGFSTMSGSVLPSITSLQPPEIVW